MKVIYEQGDIVLNHNNNTLCIVLRDQEDSVQVLEKMPLNNSPNYEQVVMNFVPKDALEYKTRVNLVKHFDDIVGVVNSLDTWLNWENYVQAKKRSSS